MTSRIAIVTIVFTLLSGAALAASPEEISTNLVAAIGSGNSAAFARDFTPALRKSLPPQAVGQLLRQLQAQAGRLVSAAKPQWKSRKTAILALVFEKDVLDLQLTFDNGKLAGMYLTPGGTPASPAVVEAAAANIEAALRKGDAGLFARDFSGDLSRSLPKSAIHALFRDLREKYGALEKRGAVGHPQPRLAVYPMKFVRGALNLILTVGADGKIQGIHFAPASVAGR